MDIVRQLIDLFLHLDRHLDGVIQNYGGWTYAILFLIIFCETGLVVTPVLPGDSLLFAAGTFAARGSLHGWWLFGLLTAAAVLGDTVNYWLGYLLGPRLLEKKHPRFLKKEYLERTHAFYEKYGPETIILCRFVPIVRTFAPFVAGVGSMTYAKFLAYNMVGGILWVGIFVAGGYWFGGLEFVRTHFALVELVIVFLSVLPMLIEFIRHRRQPS